MNFIKKLTNEEIEKYSYIKTYKVGEIVFNQGNACNHIGYLESGEISVITITHTEKEETITYLKKGDIFGDILLFSSLNIYLGHGVCKKEAIIRYFNKDHLLQLFEKKEILLSFLEELSNRALAIKKENKLFKHKNITDRVIHFLMEESLQTNSKIIKIENVTYLANILSIPRVSLSRELTKLVNEKKIEIKKKGQTCFIKLL